MQKLLADFHINPYFSGLCIINLIMYKSLIVKSTSCKSSLNALHMILTQNSKYISNYFSGCISEMQRFFTGGPRQGFKSFGLLSLRCQGNHWVILSNTQVSYFG